jgi:hypothetical protein
VHGMRTTRHLDEDDIEQAVVVVLEFDKGVGL